MTELKNYNHAEQVISPDDKQLSEQHSAERVKTQAEVAESRIKEISVSRSGRGGLDEFFGDMEHHTWLEGNPWKVADQVKRRVLFVAGQSANDYQASLGASTASRTEQQLLGYTKQDMLRQIEKVKSGGLNSLQTLETLKGFTVKAMEEAEQQREDIKEKQSKLIENRGRWSKFGHGLLTGVTLGGYQLVKTKKRQNAYNKILDRVMKRKFDKINRNIEDLEQKVGKRIAPMRSNIRRTLAAESNPVEKAAYQTELLNALQHTGDLSGVNLSKWGITKPQDKIDFLEAARGIDFVKDTLGVAVSSRAKQMAQKEVIDSSQAQQEAMKIPAKFSEVRDEMKGDGISASDKVPTNSVLVDQITKDLESAGVDTEKDIYDAKLKKADLLTDTVRLTALVNYLEGKTGMLQLSTRQSLFAWIEKREKDTSGGMEEYDNSIVKEELDVLQGADGVLDKLNRRLVRIKNLRIEAPKNVPGALNSEIEATCVEVNAGYTAFLNKEKDIPKDDFEMLKKSWEKAMEARKFMLANISKWMKEKEAYAEFAKNHDPSQKGKRSELDKEIAELSAGENNSNSIKYLQAELKTVASAVANDKVAMAKVASLDSQIKAKQATLKELKGDVDRLNSQTAPGFSGMERVQDLLDKISLEKGMDYVSRITKSKKGPGASMNERISQSLSVNDFVEELDKKFVEQLEKNDQFDDLKKVSKGTEVEITFKRTSASSLRFPDQLKNQEKRKYIVISANEDGVILERVGARGESITILGPAAKEGVAYKNAKLAKMSGKYGDSQNPRVSGSWESAIAYNFKIPA